LREGRYKASLIDSDAWLLTCMCYIEMNPVRTGMVSHPYEYRWSSYAANARGVTNALLSPHMLYMALGEDPPDRQYAYRKLFRRGLVDSQVHEIREVLNQELVLGGEDFKDKITQMAQRQVRRGRNGRPSQRATDG